MFEPQCQPLDKEADDCCEFVEKPVVSNLVAVQLGHHWETQV